MTDDLSVVEDEIASIDKRWNDLCATVGDRLQTLENIQEEIHRYQVVLRVTQKTLVEIEQIVVVEYMLVMDPNKAKQELAEVKVRVREKTSRASDQSIWNELVISKGRERECIKFPGMLLCNQVFLVISQCITNPKHSFTELFCSIQTLYIYVSEITITEAT